MNIDALVDELNSTVGWLKRTSNLYDAGRVQRAISALEFLAAELRQERERADFYKREVDVLDHTTKLARQRADKAEVRAATPSEQGERTLAEIHAVIGGYVVPCARCGKRKVIAADALNSDIEVCGRCGTEIGLHELAEQGEVEWEYGVEYEATNTESVFTATHSEEMARKWVAESPTDTGLRRRRKAGPWEPVTPKGEPPDQDQQDRSQ